MSILFYANGSDLASYEGAKFQTLYEGASGTSALWIPASPAGFRLKTPMFARPPHHQRYPHHRGKLGRWPISLTLPNNLPPPPGISSRPNPTKGCSFCCKLNQPHPGLALWRALDSHLSEEAFCRAAQGQMTRWIKTDGGIVGILRYQLFWETIPFLTLLLLKEAHRRQGALAGPPWPCGSRSWSGPDIGWSWSPPGRMSLPSIFTELWDTGTAAACFWMHQAMGSLLSSSCQNLCPISWYQAGPVASF